MRERLSILVFVLVLVCSAMAQAQTAGVTVSSPAPGSTVASSVHFVASAYGGSYQISSMRIYVDGVSKYTVNAASLNTYVSLPAGTHSVVVQAWNLAGTVYKNSFPITVSTTTSTSGGVTVSSPAPGSTVASPAHFVASATGGSYPISAMRIYVDNVSQYTVNAASLNTNMSLASGTHSVVVQAWNSAGTVYKNSFSITVPSATASTTGTTSPTSTATTLTPPTPYNIYVSTTGNDANTGTSSYPYRTIQKAVNVAKPGTTIHVLNGVYSENVRVAVSGTASSRIIIKSENKWGAKVKGPLEGYKGIFTITGNYIDIAGFEMYGNAAYPYGSNVGVWIASSYNRVYDNLIHDLTSCQSTCSNEAVGILVNFYKGAPGKYHDNTINNNIIHHMYLDNHTVHNVSASVIPAGSGVYICDGPNNIAYNNLAYSGGKQGFKLNHNAHADKFINNTAADFQWDGFMMAVGGDSTVVNNDYSVFENNIAVDNKRAGINFWQASPSVIGTHNTLSNNLTYNNPTNVAYGNIGSASKAADTAGLHVDPKFVYKSYTGSTGNFRLSAGSPAINKGSSASNPPTFDLDDRARPDGGAFDIGAYEY
jgi:hypothetical protein